jgi:GNAT superfamily N-acetyltransferase
MSTITTRRAGLADLDMLVPLFDGYRRFYGADSDPAAARRFLQARCEHDESVIFAATMGARGLGMAQLYPSFSSVGLARIYILNDLYVDPAARKQGVGARLLDAVTAFAAAAGAIRLELATATDNIAAQRLYEAVGWQRDTAFHVYRRALPG